MVSSEPGYLDAAISGVKKNNKAGQVEVDAGEPEEKKMQQQQQQDAAEGAQDRPVSPAGSGSAGYSSDSSAEPVDVSKMDPATLKVRIKAQVEYYFSQQNLNQDAYMLSQMDSEGFIPVATIATFRKVRKLTESEDAIVEAIADSTVCELSEDGTKIKNLWKRPARTTIILREAPEETKEEDIQALFQDTAFTVVSIRSEVGQSWFVTMETEDEAKDAVIHLIGKSLHGQAVKARLKSEAIRPLPQVVQPGVYGAVPPGAYAPYAYQYGNMMGYSQGWGYQMDPSQAQQMGGSNMSQGSSNRAGRSMSSSGKYSNSGSQRQGRSGPSGSNDRRRASASGNASTGSASQFGSDGQAYPFASGPGSRGGSRRPGAPGAGSNRKKSSKSGPGNTQQGPGAKRQAAAPAKPPVFKPQDFPSLSGGKPAAAEEHRQPDDDVDAKSSTTDAASVTQDVEQQQSMETSSTSSAIKSSWAAAVAKAPPAQPPQPAKKEPKAAEQDAPAVAHPQEQQQQATPQPVADQEQRVASSASAAPASGGELREQAADQNAELAPVSGASSSTTDAGSRNGLDKPAAERPKRGWEKPGMTAAKTKIAEVKEVVAEVIDQVDATVKLKAGSTASKVPAQTQQQQQKAPISVETTSKPVANGTESGAAPSAAAEDAKTKAAATPTAGPWGQKKSFADIIKSKPAAPPATAAPAAPAAPSAAPAKSGVAGGPGSLSQGAKAESASWRSK